MFWYASRSILDTFKLTTLQAHTLEQQFEDPLRLHLSEYKAAAVVRLSQSSWKM